MAAFAAKWAQHGTLSAAAQDTLELDESRAKLTVYNRAGTNAIFFRAGRGVLANVPDIGAVTDDDTYVVPPNDDTTIQVPFGSGLVIVKLFSTGAQVFSVVESE